MLCRVLGKKEQRAAVQVSWPVVAGQPLFAPQRNAAAATGAAEPEEARALRAARLAQREEEFRQQIEQASQSGFEKGRAAADQQARASVEEELKRLSQMIGGIPSLRAEMLHQAETDVVKLSVEIARRILNRELTIDPGAIEGLIKAALHKLEGQEIYRLRVHPDYESVVRNCLARYGPAGQIEIVSDPKLERGCALFEIGRGTLDASIDTQLREIEQGLADRFRNTPTC